MEKELIRRYVRGELSDSEAGKVEAALREDASARDCYAGILAQEAFSSMPDRS